MIFAHNHPSGNPGPIALYEPANQALTLIDVRVLDHIVIGAQERTSMAERGLI